MKTLDNTETSREAEGYRCMQMCSEKTTTSFLLWFLLRNHNCKQEWRLFGQVDLSHDSFFLLFVAYYNFGI